VVNALCWLAIKSTAARALRIAATMRPSMAARFLFALRIAPAAVTIFLIVGFCVPSYLWLEPDIASERVGWFCLLAAGIGAVVWALSLLRGLMSIVLTGRYLRHCEAQQSRAAAQDMVVVSDAPAVMGIAGVVHPKLVVSQTVLDALSPEQQEAAFRHEAAHRSSRDNLKRLLFLLAPDVVPLVSGLGRLERSWVTFTEWAADDEAVDGDQERALSLASALVGVAKLGVHRTPAYLLSSLMDDSGDLEVRVDRLLREPAYAEKPLQPVTAFVRNAGLVIGGVAATLLLWPESLGTIHRLLEHLVQ
jgi:Zn-dependent protease with chaperone function